MYKTNFCTYRFNWAIFKALWSLIFISLKLLAIWSCLSLFSG